MGATPLWGPEVRDDVYTWQDDAACKGADPTLFDLLNEDHPASEELDRTGMFEQNLENFEDAKSYCDRCPVRATCLATATSEDLDWTIRGGQKPRKFSGRGPGRPGNGHEYKVVNGKKRCHKNHEYDPGLERCPQCRATYRKWYLKKRLQEEQAKRLTVKR